MVPLPFVVRGSAAPFRVAANWNVFVVALITKYTVLVKIPVVVTTVANETLVPLLRP
jgi:hypothetical protein